MYEMKYIDHNIVFHVMSCQAVPRLPFYNLNTLHTHFLFCVVEDYRDGIDIRAKCQPKCQMVMGDNGIGHELYYYIQEETVKIT